MAAMAERPMDLRVTMQPHGRSFLADHGETLLDAALRQGVDAPYGCRSGTCGMCKVKLVEGQVDRQPAMRQALTEAEESQGHVLMCRSRACSDLVIQQPPAELLASTMPCRVAAIDRLAPDVVRLRLQLPGGTRIPYRAGQFLQVILRDGSRRSYSMATPPGSGEPLEFHVRHVPGGVFSNMLFSASGAPLKVRDVLRVSVPHGSFHLHEDSSRPILLLASGTGFAPIKAIVEHARTIGMDRPMTLYWGGRRPHDLYMDALARSWTREFGRFRYVPVVSDALPQDGWTARRGFVHRAVMQDHPDLSSHQVYACGAPSMVDAARRDFTARCGLPEHEFHADVFTTLADAHAQAGPSTTTT